MRNPDRVADEHKPIERNNLSLASSIAENEDCFNPLKQSQILTKAPRAPNFAHSMPSQVAFKAPPVRQEIARQSSVGRPPQHGALSNAKQHQSTGPSDV